MSYIHMSHICTRILMWVVVYGHKTTNEYRMIVGYTRVGVHRRD